MYTESEKAWLAVLGETIAQRRKFSAMTQQQLADRAGVHRTYISEIEGGSRNVTIMTIRVIAAALDTSASRLLVQTEKKFSSTIRTSPPE